MWNIFPVVMWMNRIKEILAENKLTNIKPYSQRQLALICGIAQPEINRIANNKKTDIELKTAAKIARGLNKTIEFVFPDY